MPVFKNLVCMVKGHTSKHVVHNGSCYQYCLNCGRIESTGVTPDGSTLPEWTAQKVALSILPQVRRY